MLLQNRRKKWKKLNLRLDIGGGHVGEILIEVKGIRSASISGVRTAIFARKLLEFGDFAN